MRSYRKPGSLISNDWFKTSWEVMTVILCKITRWNRCRNIDCSILIISSEIWSHFKMGSWDTAVHQISFASMIVARFHCVASCHELPNSPISSVWSDESSAHLSIKTTVWRASLLFVYGRLDAEHVLLLFDN